MNFSGKNNAKSTKVNPVVDFKVCVSLIQEIVLPLVVPKPTTLNHHQIAAFSYFYERAIQTGLVGRFILVSEKLDFTRENKIRPFYQKIAILVSDPFKGGDINVGDIFAKAKEICANANTDQPFMCLDITFIYVLLKDGYDLKPTTTIKVIFGHVMNNEVPS